MSCGRLPDVQRLIAGMRWAVALILLLTQWAAWAAEPPKGLVGIVQVPKLFGTPDPNGPPGSQQQGASGSVNAHERPTTESKAITELRNPESVEKLEYAYEESGAVVYQRKDGWYQIGLVPAGWRAWISAKDAGNFYSLEQLLTDALAYVTKHWDRTLRQSPELSAPAKPLVLVGGKRFAGDIRVVETKRIDDDLWLHVELLVPGPCSGDEAKAVAQGWIPAYARSHDLNAWFHSRGC